MSGREAMQRLTEVLRAESAALARGDAAAATGLLAAKLAAADALLAATRTGSANGPDLAGLRRLQDLLHENGRQLALAIEVQTQVAGVVARAARQPAGLRPFYRGRGAVAPAESPVALVIRA